jgi:hypothetical protein
MVTKPPGNAHDAEQRLAEFVRQLHGEIDCDGNRYPGPRVVSADLADWFVEAAKRSIDEWETLDKALGLVREGRGRPAIEDRPSTTVAYLL